MHIDLPPPTVTNPTFLRTLISNTQHSSCPTTYQSIHSDIDLSDETAKNDNSDAFIPLSTLDKSYLYFPWKFSIIVKVFGKKVGHQLLKYKLTILRRPSEELPLIDIGSDFFFIKFKQEASMHKALLGGPWFSLIIFSPSACGSLNLMLLMHP